MILAHRYNYPEEFHKKSLSALETALGQAQAYKSRKASDPGPGAPTDVRYDSIDALDKQTIREHFPDGLVPGGRNVKQGLLDEEIEYTFTSGTTGERVINIWNQDWWNRSEQASWKLNSHLAGLKYPQKEAKLASSLNVGISCEEDLPTESRIVGDKLYLNEKISIIQWQPRHYERMIRELESFKPAIIEANPSLLARLAFWTSDRGIKPYSPEVIVFTYELPSEIHLKIIREVFGSPLISSYGTTETGFVMQQCEKGFLHQNLDFCRIDFHPLKKEYGGPELGLIYVTTFDNPWNSVLRFDTGDLIRLHPEGRCVCGREHGLIAQTVEGRISNVTFTADGEPVTTLTLDRAMSEIEGIRDYHFEQNSKTDYTLILMVSGGEAEILRKSRRALERIYGDSGNYVIDIVDNILPGPSGKFRRTQTNFEYDFRELLE